MRPVDGMAAIEETHDLGVAFEGDEVVAVIRAAGAERQPRRLQDSHFRASPPLAI